MNNFRIKKSDEEDSIKNKNTELIRREKIEYN